MNLRIKVPHLESNQEILQLIEMRIKLENLL